ncbi:TIGR03936 family radical SAM-associated protein [uncultured Thermanaerothrix sp.]|uniref:TIGR03936 family radical SAM-associated protein n=1 Tax=uncultured Thermanaerothrix sp. TaxID=1195149 RepID=UPI00260D326C|nr:TIGR03936 family radical SAM-associated protein [uncultured Thermanaerothrix sp.]
MLQRFRIDYAKTQPLRYVSSLDLQKVWERYLRRAGLPLAYSHGFSPQPRLQQAHPLPLGYLGAHELVDVWLESAAELLSAEVQKRLLITPQPGIEINHVESIPLEAPSLAKQVVAADYTVWLLDPADPSDLTERIARLLNTPSLTRERRGKTYDLRPLIESLALLTDHPGNLLALQMRLAAREGASGRPEEVIAALGLDPFAVRILRTRLLIEPSS